MYELIYWLDFFRFAEELLGHLEYSLMVSFTQDIACWVEVSILAFSWMLDGCSCGVPPLSGAPGGSARDDSLLYPTTT